MRGEKGRKDGRGMVEDGLRAKQHRAKLEKQLRSERARIQSFERSWHDRSYELQHALKPQIRNALTRELKYISDQIEGAKAREADLQTELASLPAPTDTD